MGKKFNQKYALLLVVLSVVSSIANTQQISSLSLGQTDPGGKAVSYNESFGELPEYVRPNDATISLYEDRRFKLIKRRRSQGSLYTIQPKGNAVVFKQVLGTTSQALDKQFSNGYILSYLLYENGAITYNDKAKDGRFEKNVDDETLFFSHSTGKSITSYLVGHAICEGYISSIDEMIDWPMMRNTLYQGQPLRDLLNMSAGDKHTVNEQSNRVMGSATHHRGLGLDTIAVLLNDTKKRESGMFYNNFLSDVIANYVAFKAGENYDELFRKVFQDKVKIAHEVAWEMHGKTETNGLRSPFYGQPQTLASYSYFMTRMDFLRVAKAMMQDYQDQTCVGKYLKESQVQAKPWYKFNPQSANSLLWLHRYSKKYGAQFYFDFQGMDGRNIFATEGFNGQNMMIDMDKSRIVVTHSAATAWDQRTFLVDVIRDGKLPQ